MYCKIKHCNLKVENLVEIIGYLVPRLRRQQGIPTVLCNVLKIYNNCGNHLVLPCEQQSDLLFLFQHWEVFVNVSAIFVLVPSLSGLKGKSLIIDKSFRYLIKSGNLVFVLCGGV